MLYILLSATIITLGINIFQLVKINTNLKSANYKFRGFLKYYNRDLFTPEQNSLIKIWLYTTALNFICFLLFTTVALWNTDYNFFIALFPFIWHYMYFRYFLWEKSDLLEAK